MDEARIAQKGLLAFIFRGFAKAFGTSLITRALQVLLAVVLVRAIGDDGYGAYVFAGGVALIGGRLGALGTPNLMLRFVPAYRSRADWSDLSGLLRVSLVIALTSSCCVVAILAIGAAILGSGHSLSSSLLIVARLVPFAALMGL